MRSLLLLEFLALYVGAPVAFLWLPWARPILAAVALVVLVAAGIRFRNALRRRPPPHVLHWKGLAWRLALAVPCVWSLGVWLDPPAGAGLASHPPMVRAAVLASYPLVSVLPQELIYRVLFFERYGSLFPNRAALIAANALAFSFAHLMFANAEALLLTFAAGLLLAHSYAATADFRRVMIEHTAYGWLMLATGLAGFFYFAPLSLGDRFRPLLDRL